VVTTNPGVHRGTGFLDSPVVADPISRADVEHVAKLARLALTDDEIQDLTAELGSILGHAADIEALSLADVPPTAHPLPLENVLRVDEVRPSLDRDEVLAEAPAAEDGRFRVPRILGEAP
jgi:aspartyl-tRNA(Asn)/glutamyl-tRNA(Gln) amidotransferase subunit C